MKKLYTMLILLMFSVTAHAGVVSYTSLSGDSTVNYEYLNNSFTTIYDEFNGATDSDNIEDDSLKEADFSDEINPRIRTSENIGDYTYEGMLAPTATGLSSTTTAGTSYVNGFRVVTNATAHTYTASKDTWVYIDQNGAFQYEEVALDGAQPTTPSNSLLLFLVTTDGSDVTTVTDKRTTTPPNLRVYQDAITGAVISRDITTATKVTVGRGEIDFGAASGKRRNTANVEIDFTSVGRGGLDTGSLAEDYYYIWAVPDDDNENNYECVASASSSATALSITGERLIGWCYASSASAISPDSVGGYKALGSNQPNLVSRKNTTDLSYAGTNEEAIGGLETKFYSSGRLVRVTLSMPIFSADNTRANFTISADSATIATVSQAPTTNLPEMISITGVIGLGAGEYDIVPKWAGGGAQPLQFRSDDGIAQLIVEEL